MYPSTARKVTVTKEQADKAVAKCADLIEIGRNGTDGDYTDIGGLYYILEALNITLEVTHG